MGMKNPGGEIVQVQGGHIVRSTGRKDRHSKVFTAKGPRDRRVRLSAHTAIQFYDVQDRLGYDRPSKAVDWLIKKAKSAIDKLDELPPWQPTPTPEQNPEPEPEPDPGVPIDAEGSGFGFGGGEASFFPTSSESHVVQSSVNFQNYPQENLGLSLQSFHGGSGDHAPQAEQGLFGFGGGGFSNQRMMTWHDGGGFGHVAQNQAAAAALIGHVAQFGGGAAGNNQRGTLQSSSSFSQMVRAWDDLPSMAVSAAERPAHHHHQIHQPSIFGTRFVSDAGGGGGGGGFPVFCIPARIHGEDDGHGVVSEKPSSSSPNSAHR